MRAAEPPRVLQLCHGYGGPFLDCARQYAVLFRDTPYQVTTVFLTGKPSAEVEQEAASDEVIFLNYSSRDLRGAKLRAIGAIRRLASDPRYRVCIAHRFKPTFIACMATRLPVLAVNHAFGVYRRPARRLFANLFRQRLTLLGVSNAVRDDLRNSLPAWSEARIDTLYNRVDLAALQAEQISREAARAQLALPQDAWIVGNVGRLHPDKDQATLIQGFAKARSQLPPSGILVVMGAGRLESALRSLAADLGIVERVRFLGQTAKARRYFKAFDVFVLTSDHEPFGMVLLEAMAAGVATIGTDCGGASEVIGDSAMLFPLGDERQLAIRLSELAQWPEDVREAKRLQMQSRLKRLFTDAAVRPQFWIKLRTILKEDS